MVDDDVYDDGDDDEDSEGYNGQDKCPTAPIDTPPLSPLALASPLPPRRGCAQVGPEPLVVGAALRLPGDRVPRPDDQSPAAADATFPPIGGRRVGGCRDPDPTDDAHAVPGQCPDHDDDEEEEGEG
jgi:hypothetical protein